MSHIHLPDGVLPVWLWLSGIVIVAIYLFGLTLYLKNKKYNLKLALVGVFSALLIISMSIEIVPIGYHIKLVALAGIILGPIYSVLSLLIVNCLLALLGHGGITIVGLNTIVLSVEAIVAFYIYSILSRPFKNKFVITFMATLIALIVGTFTSAGVVYFGKAGIDTLVHVNERKKESFVSFTLFDTQEHTHHPEPTGHDEHTHTPSLEPDEHEHSKHLNENDKHSYFDFKKFLLLILAFGSIGWVLESIITAFIVSYVHKIKPDLLEP